MKKLLVAFIIILATTTGLRAQDGLSKKLGLGFQIGQFQKDFAFGLNLTSPYFIHGNIAVRAKGNLVWNEHPDENNEATWTPYSNFSLGLIGVAGKVGNFARLYSEGGILLLFPSDKFSTERSVFGGYGLLGFEIFSSEQTNYFIEIGGAGTGATADKLITKPIYSNGLIINAGFRFQL